MKKRCMGCMNEYDEGLEICPYCGFVEGSEPESPLHMQAGTYLADRYIVGRVMGYGGFGVTYVGWDAKLEQKVAIKEYLPSEFSTRAPGSPELTIYGGDKAAQFSKGLEKFTDEAKRLAKFQNTTGIVKVFDSFEENETAYIVMECLEGETLAAKLKREGPMPVGEAITLLMPIMESLETVHKEGILHRDIAPDNIFITKSGDAKLIDFGAARYATTAYSMSLTVLIKPGFSPEEQYRTRGDQGPHTDVYSMAATLYKAVTGKTPPDSLKRRVEFEKSNRDILLPIRKFAKDISENTENAIMNALNVRIEDRTPTMKAFIDELKSDNVKRVGNKIRRIDLLRWPLWAKITVPVAAMLIIATGVLFGMGVIGFRSNLQEEIEIPEGMARIPNVINTELSSAEETLEDLGLHLFVEGQEFSDDIPANFIQSQSPSGGSVMDKMISVNVCISAGIDGEVVPNVYGLTLDEAKAQLKKNTFTCEVTEEYDAVVAAGCVIGQSVEAGKEAAKGSVVTLTISKGRDPSKSYPVQEVKVVDFVGMSSNEVVKKAAEAGIMVKISEKKYSDSVEKDVVMKQSISAGSVITNDKVVELTVSLGKKTVIVPYVVGATEASAFETLSAKELKVTVSYEYSDSFASGLVLSQSINAKEEVAPDTEVCIVVSKGADTFSVPNVVGTSEDNARNILNGNGLRINVAYVESDAVAEGYVIDQTPISGEVKAGDTVTVTVSGKKATFAVPNVVGKSETVARNTLTGKGLQVSVAHAASSTVAEGTVISQSPASGSVKEGETVTITVSSGKPSYAVASVVGQTQSAATGTLKKQGFAVSVSEKYDSSVESGKVIEQSPEAGSSQREGSTITIVVSKGKQPVTVTFDARGGSVGKNSSTVYLTSAYGALPTPSREYYTFIGWYTQAVGGTEITSDSTVSDSADHTLYAQWKENEWSGWVLSSAVPSGAKIVDEKWTYTLREYTSNSASSLSGWTRYDSSYTWSDYGTWSDWSTSVASSSDYRQIDTKTVTDREGYTNYHYWIYRASDGYGCGTKGYITSKGKKCTEYDEIDLTYPLGTEIVDNVILYGKYDSSMFSHSWDCYWFFGGSTWVDAVTHTEYKYRDRSKIYTYYYYRDLDKETTSDPTGQSNVSDVVRYVRYQAK